MPLRERVRVSLIQRVRVRSKGALKRESGGVFDTEGESTE